MSLQKVKVLSTPEGNTLNTPDGNPLSLTEGKTQSLKEGKTLSLKEGKTLSLKEGKTLSLKEGKTLSLTKGRGAQINSTNPFQKNDLVQEHIEGIDEQLVLSNKTKYFFEQPKKIINKVDSPDLGLLYSMNPYQGCEHGCIYCYARNTHEFWGYSAGVDFEQKIIVKRNAPLLLEKAFLNPNWTPNPIMLSGNTDCYQPAERKFQLTRKMLQVLLKFQNPVSIITKNSLILRDIDLLEELAKLKLLHVSISITTLSEELRLKLEPRTATAKQRLKVVEELSKKDIPVNVMVAPVIPSLNSHEIPAIIKEASERGAKWAGYTIVRLNGSVRIIFEDWIKKTFPERSEKVLNQIAECHGGKLNDSRFGIRMKGEGNTAQMIADLFHTSRKKFMGENGLDGYNTSIFKKPQSPQLSLF